MSSNRRSKKAIRHPDRSNSDETNLKHTGLKRQIEELRGRVAELESHRSCLTLSLETYRKDALLLQQRLMEAQDKLDQSDKKLQGPAPLPSNTKDAANQLEEMRVKLAAGWMSSSKATSSC